MELKEKRNTFLIDTTLCESRLKVAYFDNNSSTFVPKDIAAVYARYLNCGNPSNINIAPGRTSAYAIEKSKEVIAKHMNLPNSDNGNILFTSCATESNNIALQGYARGHCKGKRLHMIVPETAHKCILKTAEAMKECGDVTVSKVSPTAEGVIEISSIEDQLKGVPKGACSLVSVMHANNEIGAVSDVSGIGVMIERHRKTGKDIFYHIDAVASAGRRKLSPKAWHADALSLSGHKIHAVKGVGVLYLSSRAMKMLCPFSYGGGNTLRAGTMNTPAIVALAAAFAKVQHDRLKKNDDLWELRNYILERLRNVSYRDFQGNKTELKFRVFGPTKRGSVIESTILITFLGTLSPEDLICNRKLVRFLDSRGVSVSIGSSCNTKNKKASHVLQAIGATKQEKSGTIRISMSDYTTKNDCDILIKAIKKFFETDGSV